jgi:hypothetical protein
MLVVRTRSGQYRLFTLDRNTARPRSIPQGAAVSVTSRPGEDGSRIATRVNVSTAGGQQAQTSGTENPVPPQVRDVEGEIERQARRFRGGARLGFGLDPEVITAGLQAQFGPFFNPRVFVRPSAEFGFGEVTTLVAFNLEALYRIPITTQRGRWSPYIGLGPGLNFINQSFEANQTSGRDINFSDFDFEGSLNIVAGLESRNGMFVELRGTAFSRPQIRLFLGYTF